jgi:hypothetical protein
MDHKTYLSIPGSQRSGRYSVKNPIRKTVSGLLATSFTIGLLLAGISESWAQQSIKGVWQVVEITTTGPNASTNSSPQPGLWIFTDKHYTYMTVNTDKPRPVVPAAKMTDKDRADAYRGFVASGGTYEIKGDQITMKVFVARSPETMRSGSVFGNTYKLDGKVLTVTRTSSMNEPVANPSTTKLVRLE